LETPQLPPPESLRFRARLWTRWSDEDNQQVLNNAVFATLLEEGRLRYFSALGLLDANQFPFVLLQANLRFLKPGRGGVEVELQMATTRIGSSSFEQAYRIVEAATGVVWCEAEALLVCWDPSTRRSRAMDPRFRAKLESMSAR
jgi:acyl-CoA thioesterase FadM